MSGGTALFLSLGALLLACTRGPGSEEDRPILVHSVGSEATRRYAVFLPKGYRAEGAGWPAILFLHGFGESGDDIDAVSRHGPLKRALERRNDFPFIVLAPQCPRPPYHRAPYAWAEIEPDILGVLADARSRYRVDPERIYLTGLSMGGFGAFHLAAAHPELFAAVAPVCGGGKVENAPVYRGTPFWIFHGQQDPVVPAELSIKMAEAMKAAGVEVELTLYPELGHDSWTTTYRNDALYTWFLSHRRAGKK
jgi:predicted peptidase